MSQAINLKHERAKKAYKFTEAVVKEGKLNQKEYKQYVKKLPMMIKTNGLSASLAFVFSKGKQEYKKIYEQIQEWLKERTLVELNQTKNGALIQKLAELDSSSYRVATNEVLALLEWMKRFADGMIVTVTTENSSKNGDSK